MSIGSKNKTPLNEAAKKLIEKQLAANNKWSSVPLVKLSATS